MPQPPSTLYVVPSSGNGPVMYRPASLRMYGAKAPSLMTTFTTPAMASEPYCAAAPSRRTSMRSMALAGSAFMSTPLEPAPMPAAKLWTSAVRWRRQPFTSTSAWSGLRPRRVNGRTMSLASATLWRGELTEGGGWAGTSLVSAGARPEEGAGVGAAVGGEVARGGEGGEHLAGLGRADLADLLGAVDVDRHR